MIYIKIERDSGVSLFHQVYSGIRERIITGDLRGGERLPSSRSLSDDLKVSRNVIVAAYDQLYAEGYIESRQGNGSFVAEGIHTSHNDIRKQIPSVNPSPPMTLTGFNESLIDFRSGLPDLDLFPVRKWLQHYSSVIGKIKATDLVYGSPEGRIELRQSIAGYLRSARGLYCDPQQIVITSGTTQAISLVTRLILSGSLKKDVILEDPITSDINKIIELNGGVCHPVTIDQKGLNPSLIPEGLNPGFCYVTPSHQFPLGGSMDISRRLDLIDYARSTDSYIMEDDYDSEFRYDVQPLQTLYELDSSRVIYCGTFSKTLFPALRTAYLILPPELMESIRHLKWYSDLHNATLDQLVLARFINSGDYTKHIGRMKKRYKIRRGIILDALSFHFSDQIEILGATAGMHLCVRFPDVCFDQSILERIKAQGVQVYPVSIHSQTPEKYQDTLIFGFGFLSLQNLEQGIVLLKKALTESPE